MSLRDEFPEGLNELLRLEWIASTGTGTFATSTASLANTRKQQGFFIAPTSKGFKRYVYVSKVEDRLAWEDERLDLTTTLYRDAVFPEGFKNLVRHSLSPSPSFVFDGRYGRVKKTVHPVAGERTIALRYVIESNRECTLMVRPLLALRYLHSLNREREISLGMRHAERGLFLRPGEHPVPPLFLLCDQGTFVQDFCWYRSCAYLEDRKKGDEHEEDLPSPGYFLFTVGRGRSESTILFTLEEKWWDMGDEPPGRLAGHVRSALRKKPEYPSSQELPHHFQKNFSPLDDSISSLITRFGTHSFAMSGYPYYAVNVYDLLLFLQNYLIRGGLVSDASSVIDFLAPFLKRGLLPKYINEEGDPIYCAADTSLLFVEQIMRYLLISGDRSEIEQKLYLVREVVHPFLEGTDFHIHMDEECLVRAGTQGVEATWMDRVAGTRHLNMRYGAAVDTNALWYNALCIYRDLSMAVGQKKESRWTVKIIPKVKSSFLARFVSPEHGYLVDVIRDGEEDRRIRPNQLFALTLTNPVISPTFGKRMLQKMKVALVTDYGLRTLGPESDGYAGTLTGNEEERLHALFNGSVMPHLALTYSEALLYAYGPNNRVANRIRRFLLTLRRAAERTVPYLLPEAFDGDPPHEAKGSPASLNSSGAALGLYRLYDSILARK